jgi:hypothetical protein
MQQQPIERQARERRVGELVHALQRQRRVVRQLERLNLVVATDFADEGADSPEARVRVGERPDELARVERPVEQADVLRHVSRR